MAKKRNAEALDKRRKEKEIKQQKINDVIAYVVAGIALIAVVGLIIYSYTR